VGEPGHVHCGDRRSFPVAAPQRIAADFEAAPKGSEFGKDGVANCAGLASLTGEGWQRVRGSTLATSVATAA